MKNLRINKVLQISVLLCLFAGAMVAQPSFNQLVKKGNEAYNENNFSGALEYFSQAVERDNSKPEVIFKYAESARKQFAYSLAESQYQYLIDILESNEYPEALFHLAGIKNTLGNYDDAIRYYDLYLSEYENDNPKYTLNAKKAKESAEWASEQPDYNPEEINIVHLDGSVNTAYSEHAPIFVDDELYFTSGRFDKEKDDYKPRRKVSKIIKTTEEKPQMVLGSNSVFNSDEKLTSSTAISDDSNLMVYSICDYYNNNIRCDLYYSMRKDSVWQSPVALPTEINSSSSTQTQPSFGPEVGGRRVLYFSSNRSLGKGGMDIWQTSFDEKMNFTTPKPVDQINTSGDEITPFYFDGKKELSFSSNGRKGFGAFDVYKAKYIEGDFQEITNLGKGVNTSFNDIFYSVNDRGNIAHLASNRPGSMYLESKFETCCFDIYRVENNTCVLDLMALTFNAVSKEDLDGVTLVLEDLKNPDQEKVILTHLDKNDFELPVDCDGEYRITATKDGFQPSTIDLNMMEEVSEDKPDVEKKIYLIPNPITLEVITLEKYTELDLPGATVQMTNNFNDDLVSESRDDSNVYTFQVIPGVKYRLTGIKSSYNNDIVELTIPVDAKGNISQELFLDRGIKLDVTTLEKATMEKLNGATVQLFDIENNRLLDTKTNLDGSDYTFYLKPGGKYKLIASKDGYDDYSIDFDVPASAKKTIYKELPIGRKAEIITLAKLLPIRLYYDNDMPEPRTMKVSTNKAYKDTYYPYFAKKESFAQNYSKTFKTSEKESARLESNSFFDNEVKTGFDKITIFLETLNRVLESGKNTNIYLRGYASPLSGSEYNEALGKRRVDCIRNEFKKYKGGILLKYIDSGRLIITERSFGEDTSPNGISDDPGDQSNSIYSPNASRERRIEIDEIVELNN